MAAGGAAVAKSQAGLCFDSSELQPTVSFQLTNTQRKSSNVCEFSVKSDSCSMSDELNDELTAVLNGRK